MTGRALAKATYVTVACLCWSGCFLSYGRPVDKDAGAPRSDSGTSRPDSGVSDVSDAASNPDAGETAVDASADAAPSPEHPCESSRDCFEWYEFGAHCVAGLCCNGWGVEGVCMCGTSVGGCGDGLWNCCDSPLTDFDDDVEDCQEIPICPRGNEF